MPPTERSRVYLHYNCSLGYSKEPGKEESVRTLSTSVRMWSKKIRKMPLCERIRFMRSHARIRIKLTRKTNVRVSYFFPGTLGNIVQIGGSYAKEQGTPIIITHYRSLSLPSSVDKVRNQVRDEKYRMADELRQCLGRWHTDGGRRPGPPVAGNRPMIEN